MGYYTTMAQEADAALAMAEAARQTYAAALKNGPDQSTVPELDRHPFRAGSRALNSTGEASTFARSRVSPHLRTSMGKRQHQP